MARKYGNWLLAVLALAFLIITPPARSYATSTVVVSIREADAAGTEHLAPGYQPAMLGPEYRGRSTPHGPNDEYIPDEVVIRFRSNVSPAARAALLNAHGMVLARRIYGDEALVMRVAAHSALTVANALRNNPLLEIAGVNPIMRSFGTSTSAPQANPAYTTNDPLAPDQMHLDSQNGGINAREAWDYGRGLNQVSLIAVLDSRIDEMHEEFRNKYRPENWVNFVSSSGDASSAGHGTEVAGLALASTDNALGIAGTGFTAWPMSLIIDDGILTPPLEVTLDRLTSAVNWAADHGASVINISQGCPRDANTACYPANSVMSALKKAVDKAYARGITIVAAAGNGGMAGPAPNYPAAFGQLIEDTQLFNWPYNEQLVIAVGGSQLGHREPGSSYGLWLDFMAPNKQDDGQGLLTTEPLGGPLYGRQTGTSWAAPQVSGLAALLTSLGYSNNAVWQFIKDGATDLPCDTGSCPGYDQYTGWGRVNMGLSMESAHHTMGNAGMTVVPNAGYRAGLPLPGGQWFNIQGSGFTPGLPQGGVQICLTSPQSFTTCYGVKTDNTGATGLGVQITLPSPIGLWNVSMCEGFNCTYSSFTVLPDPP